MINRYRWGVLLLLMLLFSLSNCRDEKPEDPFSQLDELAEANQVSGFALIRWEQNKIRDEYYGAYANIADSILVGRNTVFEAASLSKTVFSGLFIDFCSSNEISFDSVPEWKQIISSFSGEEFPDTAYQFLLELDSAQLNSISLGSLLSHSSGIGYKADMSLVFKPEWQGQYIYSDEAFLLLQYFLEYRYASEIEAIPGFESMAFPPLDFTFECTGNNCVSGYDEDMNFVRPLWQSDRVYIHGSLCCTAIDFASWWLQRYNEKPDNALFEPSPYLHPQSNKATLGAALLEKNGHRFIYQHGNDSFFQNLLIHDVNTGEGFVVFTNSANGFNFINDILYKKYPELNLNVSIFGLGAL